MMHHTSETFAYYHPPTLRRAVEYLSRMGLNSDTQRMHRPIIERTGKQVSHIRRPILLEFPSGAQIQNNSCLYYRLGLGIGELDYHFVC
jgi:hypothetical protein